MNDIENYFNKQHKQLMQSYQDNATSLNKSLEISIRRIKEEYMQKIAILERFNNIEIENQKSPIIDFQENLNKRISFLNQIHNLCFLKIGILSKLIESLYKNFDLNSEDNLYDFLKHNLNNINDINLIEHFEKMKEFKYYFSSNQGNLLKKISINENSYTYDKDYSLLADKSSSKLLSDLTVILNKSTTYNKKELIFSDLLQTHKFSKMNKLTIHNSKCLDFNNLNIFPNLINLNIENAFIKPDLIKFQKLSILKSVSFNNCGITNNKCLSILSKITNSIDTLSLKNNIISQFGFIHKEENKEEKAFSCNLKKIDLSNNKIFSFPTDKVNIYKQFEHAMIIDLSYNPLTSMGISYIFNNEITDDGKYTKINFVLTGCPLLQQSIIKKAQYLKSITNQLESNQQLMLNKINDADDADDAESYCILDKLDLSNLFTKGIRTKNELFTNNPSSYDYSTNSIKFKYLSMTNENERNNNNYLIIPDDSKSITAETKIENNDLIIRITSDLRNGITEYFYDHEIHKQLVKNTKYASIIRYVKSIVFEAFVIPDNYEFNLKINRHKIILDIPFFNIHDINIHPNTQIYLKELILERNFIKDDILLTFFKNNICLFSLTSLNLNNNYLTEKIFDYNFFISFPLLQILKLNNNSIDNISNDLVNLIKLKEDNNREKNAEINEFTFSINLGLNPFERIICNWLLCNKDMNKIDINWLQGVIINFIEINKIKSVKITLGIISINDLIGLNDF